jgi:hypothetical protein
MSAITQLNRDIGNLQKVSHYLQQVKGATYKSKEVWQTASFIRDKFDLFDQRWRDGLKNDFFYFCYPKHAVFDGHIPHVAHPNDQALLQEKFETGCLQLEMDIASLLKRMQDFRAMLLRQQNLGAVVSAFNEFDQLSFSVFQIGQSGVEAQTEMEDELKQWDRQLHECLEQLKLSSRFSSIFADSAEPLKERIQNREQTIAHFMETLASNPNDSKGISHVTINNHQGFVNTGDGSRIQNVSISLQNSLNSLPDKEFAGKINAFIHEIEESDLPEPTKVEVMDRFDLITGEATKPADQRLLHRINDNIKGVGEALKGAAALKAVWDVLEQPVRIYFGI